MYECRKEPCCHDKGFAGSAEPLAAAASAFVSSAEGLGKLFTFILGAFSALARDEKLTTLAVFLVPQTAGPSFFAGRGFVLLCVLLGLHVEAGQRGLDCFKVKDNTAA